MPRTPAHVPALGLALLLLLFASATPVGRAQDGSIGVSPGVVSLPDAQPGQTYQRTVTVQNQFAEATTFTVSTAGAAGNWTTTDPAGPVTVPANGRQAFTLSIAVPGNTGPGNHSGQVTFTTEAKEDPSGSGQSLQRGVAVRIEVHVGGAAREAVTWLSARAPDVAAGDSLLAHAAVRNDGNVRVLATATATVVPLGGGEPLAQGNGTVELDPGQTGEATIDLGRSLPPGQYVVQVRSTPAGFSQDVEVKVTEPGAGDAPDGVLRGLLNRLRVAAGRPVEISAWFENTGEVDIAAARFVGQVLRDGTVVDDVSSEAVAVPAGEHANLTFRWAPPSPGAYRIVGHVEYDGFRTEDSEGRVEAHRAPSDVPWLLLGILALVAVGVLAAVVTWRRQGARLRGRPPS